ncbi:uncharacterized protein LOC131950245 [Physella acuta]|uniref:uncharacterized protein LOC131950245 n=1 Tax=Physella acuta TaxID=109671 RepID=UPI0027DE47D0|nr:uncharacterized protein LOC131950245 [Physella acuta]
MKTIFLLITTILTLNITSDSHSLDCSKKLMAQDIQITCKRMTDGKDRKPKFVIKLKEDSELTTPESDCTTTNCTITCQQLIALEDLGIGQHKLFAILYLTSGQVYSYSAEVSITLDFPSIALKNCDYDERHNISVHCMCERTDVSEIETWIYMYINDVEQYKTSGNNLQFSSVISGSTALRCVAENGAGWRSNTASVYYNLPNKVSIYNRKNAGMALAVLIVVACALYYKLSASRKFQVLSPPHTGEKCLEQTLNIVDNKRSCDRIGTNAGVHAVSKSSCSQSLVQNISQMKKKTLCELGISYEGSVPEKLILKSKLQDRDKENLQLRISRLALVREINHLKYELDVHKESLSIKGRSLEESEKQTDHLNLKLKEYQEIVSNQCKLMDELKDYSELLKNKQLIQDKEHSQLRNSGDALVREINHLKYELNVHKESLSIKSRSLEESEKQTVMLKNKLQDQDKEHFQLRISRDALVREINHLQYKLDVHKESLIIKSRSLEESEKQNVLLKNKVLVQDKECCELRISNQALEQEKNLLKKELDEHKESLSIKSRPLEESEKQTGSAFDHKDVNMGLVSEDLQKYLTGRHEVQECSKGQTKIGLRKHFVNCKKNPGHKMFIPVKNFTTEHFSSDYRDDDLIDLTKALADLTVMIAVKFTSPDRPKFVEGTKILYPCYNTRGQDLLRTGTGWVKRVDKKTVEMNIKCQCSECKLSDTPSKEWWVVYVQTSRHVIFDSSEVKQSSCRLWFDDDKSPGENISGWEIVGSNTKKNFCYMYYVTHDLVLGDKLENMMKRFNVLDKKVSAKYESRRDVDKLTIIVSHPHGCSKQVSVGHWVDRKVHSQEVQGKMLTWYTYTNCTCPGSSGARVYRLGYYGCELYHSLAYRNSVLKCSSLYLERCSTVCE